MIGIKYTFSITTYINYIDEIKIDKWYNSGFMNKI